MLKPPPPVGGIPLIKVFTAPLVSPRATTACGDAVRSIKHIAPPVINLANHSARSNKSNPKRHFKDHVSGPAIDRQWNEKVVD